MQTGTQTWLSAAKEGHGQRKPAGQVRNDWPGKTSRGERD